MRTLQRVPSKSLAASAPGNAAAKGTALINTIEVQRLLRVIQETVARLEHVRQLTPEVLAYRHHFSASMSPELSQQLDEHVRLARQLRDLDKQLSTETVSSLSMRSLGDFAPREPSQLGTESVSSLAPSATAKNDLSELQRQRLLVEQKSVCRRLRQSTRQLLRTMHEAPELVSGLGAQSFLFSQSINALVDVFRDLHHTTYERLLTSFEEDQAHGERLREVARREQKVNTELLFLQRKLEFERSDYRRRKDERQRQIQMLKMELRQVAKSYPTVAVKQGDDVSQIQDAQSKTADIEAEVSELQDEVARLTVSHRDQEYVMRRQLQRSEEEVAGWIQRYDTDMFAIDKEIGRVREALEADTKVLERAKTELKERTLAVTELLREEQGDWLNALASDPDKMRSIVLLQRFFRFMLARRRAVEAMNEWNARRAKPQKSTASGLGGVTAKRKKGGKKMKKGR